MPLFNKKQKKVTTYSEGKEVPENIPELEVPRPVVREIPTPQEFIESREPPMEKTAAEDIRQEIENNPGDYFDNLRDYAFIEGLSFAISTLRQAQNDIIRRQQER